ncbi:MAG: hypothetical protein AAB263_19990 [Planctomycetota bacterium]
MQFVSASSLRQPRAWRAIRSGKAVVTNRGKPMALVLPITDATFDAVVEQVSQIEAVAAMRNMQAHAKATGKDRMTDDQVQAVIADVRKRRHARRS